MILLLTVQLLACDPQGQKNSKARHDGSNDRISYLSAQRAASLTPVQNPVDHALSLVGLKRADLRRPLSHEEGYNLMARNPVIDNVAASPFHLHHWADTNSTLLQEKARQGLRLGFSHLLEMLNGGVSYAQRADAAGSPSSVAASYVDLCRRFGVVPRQKVLADIERAGFADEFDRHLAALITQLAHGAKNARKAFARLDQSELAFLKSRPERFFFPDGLQFNFLTAPTHTQSKIVSITRKIDFVSLFAASVSLAREIDNFWAYIVNLEDIHDSANYFADGKDRTDRVLEIPTPLGSILILGQGSDVYAGNAALVVDLGGNDAYPGRSGVGHLVPGSISIGIDISGNDIYDSKKDRFAQGSGILGIGMIVDFSGDDKYFAGDMAQGCGIYGVGLVADLAGDDIYRMGLMGQGFGVFGAGMLLDRAGNDTYMIRGMGQGAGSTMGIGSLCDLSGNDKYLADRNKKRGSLNPDKWSHVQGAGFSIRSPDWTRHLSIYGGIGFLNDGSGNDFYFASDGNSMGSSYFMSLGALVDHGGHDRYLPQNGSGLAYAVHLTNAVVIDRDGNDYYFASTHSGGVGSDRSVALLIDYAGDDVYGPSEAFVAKELKNTADRKNIKLAEAEIGRAVQTKLADVSYGSALKPKALGFLIDVNGNDQYFARQNGWGESLGGIMPPVVPENWSFALLIDLNGTDLYSKPGRHDNHYVAYFDHGLCYDTEFSGTLKIFEAVQPDNQRLQPEDSVSMGKFLQPAHYADLQDLLDPDLFVRYQALGRIIEDQGNLSADIMGILSISPDPELNRDLIETVLIRIVNRRLDLNNHRKFEMLLSANDPEVRRFAARTLGWFRIQSAATAMLAALGEENDDIRSDIIWALGRMNSAGVVEPLKTVIQKDPSLICRRSAVAALSRVMRRPEDLDLEQIQKSKSLFIAMLDDPDEIIRTRAAGALKVFGNEPDTIAALKHSLEDQSVYVQRAAAKSLALSGTKAGIPVLIETLRYPSIDTYEHYDHDLVKDIVYYTGVDFPGEKRYNYHTWQRWWQENGRGLNLQLNLAIMEKIERAFRATHEDPGIRIFDKLLVEYPDNAVVKRRYKRFCYEWITYHLLTRRHVNKEILERCLRLQKIMVALTPDDPESVASLAYFLARLQKLDEAIAAMQKAIHLDPEDRNLRKTLELYLELREQS